MSVTEYHWIGHDNSIDLILKSKAAGAAAVAVDTSSFTKITLTLDDQTIESTNQANDPIRWNQGGYATGEIRIRLDAETVNAGKHEATLVVYDATNTDGVVWVHDNDLIIQVYNDPEV